MSEQSCGSSKINNPDRAIFVTKTKTRIIALRSAIRKARLMAICESNKGYKNKTTEGKTNESEK